MSLFAMCILTSGDTKADDYRFTSPEPISPIPQRALVDIDKARIGKQLFSDPRLSKNTQISCASCHQLAMGGDENVGKGRSISADRHIINTPSVFNAVYNFRQNWDGSAKTLSEQIDFAIRSHHEFDNDWSTILSTLSSDRDFVVTFKATYTDGLNRDNLIDALVEYEKTLITPNSRFDKFLRNETDALNPQELEGYIIFKDLGCISCHQGINIGGNLYQKFGVFYNYIAERGDIKKADYGRMNITHRQSDAFVFKVPSLRNIAVTAPYLHDGSADTLEEVISIMGKTQLGRNLTVDEVDKIKAFLNTLTGEFENRSLEPS